jgi:ribosomal protein S4E
MSLVQLIYVSSATHELSAAEIKKILDTAVMRNGENKVTGMLLYSRGSFLQVLEGEESAVTETIDRIRADPRHKDVTILTTEPVSERQFGDWSMAFRGIGASDAKDWPGYAPFVEFGFNPERFGAKPGLALEMLAAFARQK